MEPFILFFAAFLVVVVIAGAILMYQDIRHSQYARAARLEQELKDRAMRRTREFNTLRFDERGNPEIAYNRRTGEYFVPPIGNSSIPVNLYIQPGQAGQGPRQTIMRPPKSDDIQIRAWNAKFVDGTVDTEEAEKLPAGPEIPEISAPPENRNFSKVEPEKAENFENFSFNTPFQAELIQAKKAGEGKTEAIQRITGARPGGSKAWTFYRDLWDNL